MCTRLQGSVPNNALTCTPTYILQIHMHCTYNLKITGLVLMDSGGIQPCSFSFRERRSTCTHMCICACILGVRWKTCHSAAAPLLAIFLWILLHSSLFNAPVERSPLLSPLAMFINSNSAQERQSEQGESAYQYSVLETLHPFQSDGT